MFEVNIINGLPVMKSVNINRIDASNAEIIKSQIINILNNNNVLIIDFSNINYIDSSGFGALLSAYDFSKKNHKQILFASIPESTMGLLKITKLNEVFSTYKSVDEAIMKV